MDNQLILNYKIIKKISLAGRITLYTSHLIDNPKKIFIAKIFDKTLSGEPEVQKNFDKILPLVANLDHPNIIKIIDYIRTDDYMAVFTEALEGQNLQFVVLIKGLSKQAILEIFTSVLKAVEYAHGFGIYHKNLKPSNVFISGKYKNLKLLDFCVTEILSLYRPENIIKYNIENPMFMSPEMVKGEKVDCRTDIYSLGVLLYFMFSHKTPYLKTAPNNLLIENVINDPVPDLIGYKDIDEIIKKATAKNPDLRYQTCSEFLEDIQKK
ncbi:MAG: serine/threonine protein kinase [Bacteroidales bacterium]|nr:serine/threonine protein kinase [Bacteroidales bacterium]